MTRPTAPKGTRDIVGEELTRFRLVEDAARRLFGLHGFQEIRPPVFESRDLFSRSVGETSDIVEKEMFSFEDRGGRSLALRPEGTAGVVRAFLEHGFDQNPRFQKLFYMGPMFRAERPQAGRYREFWQVGAESFGNLSPLADAEMMFLAHGVLQAAGVDVAKLRFHVNTLGDAQCRPAHRAALTHYLLGRRDTLCEHCQRRLEKNPLRVLDCKVDGPTLTDAPPMADFLCAPCRAYDEDLQNVLAEHQRRHGDFVFVKDPAIVRGLDYYVRTVFEIKSTDLGAQDAVGAGGRYDGLVKQLGGPDLPGVGFALGLDRSAKLIRAEKLAEIQTKRVFFAFDKDGATVEPWAATLLEAARETVDARPNVRRWEFDFGSRHQSLNGQLRRANSWGADWVVFCRVENGRPDVAIKFMRDAGGRQDAAPASPNEFQKAFSKIIEESSPVQ
jgi:histidyl-tRNA synthetase